MAQCKASTGSAVKLLNSANSLAHQKLLHMETNPTPLFPPSVFRVLLASDSGTGCWPSL